MSSSSIAEQKTTTLTSIPSSTDEKKKDVVIAPDQLQQQKSDEKKSTPVESIASIISPSSSSSNNIETNIVSIRQGESETKEKITDTEPVPLQSQQQQQSSLIEDQINSSSYSMDTMDSHEKIFFKEIQDIKLQNKKILDYFMPPATKFNKYNKWQKNLDRYIGQFNNNTKPNGWTPLYITMFSIICLCIVGLIIGSFFVKRVANVKFRMILYSFIGIMLLAGVILLFRVYDMVSHAGESYYGMKMTALIMLAIFCILLGAVALGGQTVLSENQDRIMQHVDALASKISDGINVGGVNGGERIEI